MKRKYVKRHPKSIMSATENKQDAPVYHPEYVSLSKDCSLPWYSFTQAMYNCNNNVFIPNILKSPQEFTTFQKKLANRFTKPDYNDNNNAPV